MASSIEDPYCADPMSQRGQASGEMYSKANKHQMISTDLVGCSSGEAELQPASRRCCGAASCDARASSYLGRVERAVAAIMRMLTLIVALAAAATASAHASGAMMLVPTKHTAASRAQQPLAMVIPGDSAAEAVLIGGGLNFLSLYTGVLSLRILLSWFPQAQGVAFLAPIFTVSDVYLNLFRGIIPPIAGFDLSPIAAFFTLNLLTNSIVTLGSSGPTQSGDAPKYNGLRGIRTIADRIRPQLMAN